MPKRIIKVIKKMGAGLESAHDGEMLSLKQKNKIILKQKKRTTEKPPIKKN